MNTTRSQLHGPTDFNGKKALVNWPSVAVYASTETWPSGRRRSPAKGVGEESSRGFESLRLRHHILTISVAGISVDIPA